MPGTGLEFVRQLRQRLVHLRHVKLLDLLLNRFPKQRNIQVAVAGEGGVFRQQIQFLERMGLLAEDRPDHAVVLAGIMMDDHLVIVEALLASNGTDPHAADVRHAAVLDDVVNDFKNAGHAFAAHVRRGGHLGEKVAVGGDGRGQFAQDLLR